MNLSYIKSIMSELEFPSDAIKFLSDAADCAERYCGAEMDAVITEFNLSCDYARIDEPLSAIAEKSSQSIYTTSMLMLLGCMEELEQKYAKAGYSRDLLLESMADLRYKLLECKMAKGIYGTFVAGWFAGFYNMTRFALGRFQYEKVAFDADFYGCRGNFIKRGDIALNIHIPASGVPMTDEIRMDSYRRAKKFFFPETDRCVPFVCHSWLLYPPYEEYMPDSLNTKHFRHDFTILRSETCDTFYDGWRVFGDKADLPADRLPRNTAQQRLFADFCRDGGTHGFGYGVFFFDGEKIVK